ncbi:MAG: hypothetical protein J7605_29515 [Variovorax sp.]|nr:hypothetical protein [Variovorax sp.]
MKRISELIGASFLMAVGGLALAQTTPDPAIVTLEVLDSTGASVGQFDLYRHAMRTKVAQIATSVSLYTPEDQTDILVFFPSGELYFPSSDCTGQAYVRKSQELGWRPSVTMQTKSGKWRLYVAADPVFAQLPMASMLRGPNSCSPYRPRSDWFSPALDPVNLENKFSGPFTLR